MTKRVEDGIRTLASSLPGVTQGVACAGTKLEATTFDAGGKSFVFVRRLEAGYEVRLKLSESQDEARSLAAADPARWSIGAGGWAKLVFDDASAPLEQLRRWIPESHAALAAKPKPGKATAKPATKAKPAKQRSASAPGRVSGSDSAARDRRPRGR